MNKSDSERIATVLEKMNYTVTTNRKDADLIVINMCSIRQAAVDRILGLNNRFKKNNKQKIIITGCVLKNDLKKMNSFDYFLPIKSLHIWPKLLKNYHLTKLDNINYLKTNPKRKNASCAFIPISNGCNNFCSYCVVPFTRGLLICRDHKDVLKEVKKIASNSEKEIWLLGQNVNDYRSPIDPNVNFTKLLKMIDNIPGNFRLFFISPHPKNFSEELIEVLANCKKFSKCLNLPVQSGDNEILRRMNRNYTVKEYRNLVQKIRKKIPEIKLSTDAIVGFPGETKKQFLNTAKLLKDIKFDWAYISKYSPRPGTAAFNMKDNIPLTEKKQREKILQKILKKHE